MVCTFVYTTEEEWGEGLKVLSTYIPESCDYRAQNGDVIHYHYVGMLDDGTEFGKRSVGCSVKILHMYT